MRFFGRSWGWYVGGKINRKDDNVQYNIKYTCNLSFLRNTYLEIFRYLDICMHILVSSLQNVNHSKYLQYFIINRCKDLEKTPIWLRRKRFEVSCDIECKVKFPEINPHIVKNDLSVFWRWDHWNEKNLWTQCDYAIFTNKHLE